MPCTLGKVSFGGGDYLEKVSVGRLVVGKGVKVFKDPWLPRPTSFRPVTTPCCDALELRVADLMMFSGWDLTRIADIFLPLDRELIRSIPLSDLPRPDHVLVWHFSSNGSYSVKSGYHFEMKDREAASSSNRLGEAKWWRKL